MRSCRKSTGIVLALMLVSTHAGMCAEEKAAGQPPSDSQTLLYLRECGNLVKKGLIEGGGIDAVQPHYEAALAVCRSDPRLHYAWGLVLLKNAKPRQAKQQFELACKTKDPGCWCAWLVLAREHIVDGNCYSALRELEQLAEQISAHAAADEADAASRSCVCCIGRLLGYLERTAAGNTTLNSHVASKEQRILELLTSPLREEYLQAKSGLLLAYSTAVAAEQQKRATAEQKRQERTDQRIGQATESVDRVEDAKEQLIVQGRKLSEKFREQAKLFQEEDARLQGDYAVLLAEEQSLVRALQNATAIRAPLEVVGNLKRQLGFNQENKKSQEQQRLNLFRQWQIFLADNQVTMQQMAQLGIAVQGQQEQAQREMEVAQQRAEAATAKPASPQPIEIPLTRFFPLDFKSEGDRLFDSLAADYRETAP